MIKVCEHLKNKSEEEYIQYFTGKGKLYYCVCLKCAENEEKAAIKFSHIDEAEMKNLYLEEIKGRPELIVNIDETLFFEHEYRTIDLLSNRTILFTLALENSETEEYMFLTEDKKLIVVNFESMETNELPLNISNSKIDFSKNVEIKISSDDKLLAVYNFLG